MSACPYDICDGSGFRYDEQTNTAYDCRCRPQRQARARARSLRAVIPPRYSDIGFERFPVTEIEPRGTVEATRQFVSRIGEHIDAGRGLWFMGGAGNGKTTLALLVTKAALDAGRSAARYTLPDLLRRIRTTFDDGSHGALFESLVSVDLLQIDDIGAEQTTPWVLEELYSIINARYEERRSMVITTNIVDREQLCEQINERTVSRLTEMCDELPVLGPDLRMEPRVAEPRAVEPRGADRGLAGPQVRYPY